MKEVGSGPGGSLGNKLNPFSILVQRDGILGEIKKVGGSCEMVFPGRIAAIQIATIFDFFTSSAQIHGFMPQVLEM
jgi:hypothetical protein